MDDGQDTAGDCIDERVEAACDGTHVCDVVSVVRRVEAKSAKSRIESFEVVYKVVVNESCRECCVCE